MSRRASIESMKMDEGINLTPLLDVLFNLIFFFILATTIKDKEAFLDVMLPAASAAAPATAEKEAWTIVITADQKIFLNGDEVDAPTLATRLEETSPDDIAGVVVRGDALAHHGTLVQALDALARAGHSKVKIEVAPAEG